MERIIRNIPVLGILATILLLSACEKETKLYLSEQTDLSGKAFIKVYSATLNATRNYVYIDNIPVTGAGIAYGGLFPSISYYSAINPGTRNIEIRDTLLTTTQTPVKFSNTFDAGSNYTIFTYDTITATKQLVVKDNIEVPKDSTARIRFANLIFARTAVPAVDIFSIKRQANIFSNVATNAVTGFIPFATDIADTLFVRAAGTTTNLTQLNGILPREKRSYTVVFRGNYQVTSGTSARTLTSFTTY
ncbi:MAG: DUF4397 domain-containing protein [Chitinophagia bacterium]|nr:DUF4397 domain-containing protein [Chitinophagia bacterium]